QAPSQHQPGQDEQYDRLDRQELESPRVLERTAQEDVLVQRDAVGDRQQIGGSLHQWCELVELEDEAREEDRRDQQKERELNGLALRIGKHRDQESQSQGGKYQEPEGQGNQTHVAQERDMEYDDQESNDGHRD